jgi:hypothetical protein
MNLVLLILVPLLTAVLVLLAQNKQTGKMGCRWQVLQHN